MNSIKTKKFSCQRLTFPSSSNSSPNKSFIISELKNIQKSKQGQNGKITKNFSQSLISGPKLKSQPKKYLINSNLNSKKERKSTKCNSLSVLNNQTKIPYSKIEEKTSIKYIINSPKSPTLKNPSPKNKKNTSLLIQTKSSSKKSFTENKTKNPLLDIKNRFSINQNGKLKKKKMNQPKNVNKTFFQDRGSTTLYDIKRIQGFEARNTAKPFYDGMSQIYKSYKVSPRQQNQQKITRQIQFNKTSNLLNLQNVRACSASLCNNLTLKQQQKLIEIAKGYENIIAQLSLLIYKKSDVLQPSQSDFLSEKIPIKGQLFSQNLKSSQSTQTQSHTNTPTPQSSPRKIKKLQNLQMLRHSLSIKSYQDEFMANKEEFSESWKRQLKKEKQF